MWWQGRVMADTMHICIYVVAGQSDGNAIVDQERIYVYLSEAPNTTKSPHRKKKTEVVSQRASLEFAVEGLSVTMILTVLSRHPAVISAVQPGLRLIAVSPVDSSTFPSTPSHSRRMSLHGPQAAPSTTTQISATLPLYRCLP